ncbi:MAG TPA: PD-(D/E)XK nuclease family protein, partial [Trueperaceae bacterium]|nr:PD-(D/E)XK nuclease family protein [Trueperaceae bacterium]
DEKPSEDVPSEDGPGAVYDAAVTERPPHDLGVDLARSFTAAYGSSPASPATTDARLRGLRLPNQEDEVRHVLSRTKELLREGVEQGSITLIARDEQLYGPLVEAIAWEYGVPVKLSYEVPLRSTRLGELVAGTSAALSEGLPFEATARLLAHPLIRALDGAAWGAARRSHPSGVAAWSEIAPAASLLEWPLRGSVERYLSHLQRLFDETGVAARLSERETRARQLLESSLAEYDQRAVMPLAGFLALIDELISVLSVSLDPPSKRGVEFHTPLAVFGASYEHVFIMGAAEGLLPAPLRDDPLLDFLERGLVRTHGLSLEDAMEAAERENLSFMAAVTTAVSSLTISYPTLLDNREQLASPFFAAFGVLAPSAPGPRPAASEAERLILTLREENGPAKHAWQVEARRESDAPPDVFDGIIGMPVDVGSQRYSASQLATLGQCAFRWFAQRRLRLAEPEEAEEDVSPSLLGSLYHKTLELVTRRALREVAAGQGGAPATTGGRGWSEATAAAFRAAAAAHLDDAFTVAQTELGAPTAASWPLQRREHLAKLTRVINADDFLLPRTEVVRLEDRFEGHWRGFPVSGFVDRVDDGENGLVLTDYKTGKSQPLGAKNSRGEPKLDLQLPLYVETAAPAWFGAERPVATARYFSLNGATTISEANIDDEELRHFVARAMKILGDGDFPVDPDEEQKVCTYCDFDAVCRRGPRLGRKRQRTEREAAAADAAVSANAGAAPSTPVGSKAGAS